MTRMMSGTAFKRFAGMMALVLTLAACNNDAVTPVSNAATSSSSGAGGSDTPATTDPLQFTSETYTVAQSEKSITLTVTRSGTVTDAASIDYATADGTAIAGTDYTAATGTLQWAENDATSKTISVPISNATAFSGDKTFSVALSSPSASAQLGTPDSATVTITGNGTMSAGSVQLSGSKYSVNQGAGTVTVTVNRSGGASGAASVAYATANGTAVSGTDFTATSGVLEWADGTAMSKSFTVAISNANPFTGSESFSVLLSSASAATLGSPNTATVTITGDQAVAGSLSLTAASYSVAQGAGSVSVTVNRLGGSTGAVSVAYATTGGTAVSGTDFTATSGVLNWASGDASAKTFAVPVSNKSPFAGNKAFTIALSAPSGGATISNPGLASVTIAGDAVAAVGSLNLSAASFSVTQAAGNATITVDRTGGSAGAVSVSYATSNGTAVAGTDYTASNGTLNWANGDAAAKTFTVPVSNATPFSGSRSFNVTLSNASGGATTSTPASATVAITGDAAASVGSLQLSAATYTVAQNAARLAVTVNRTGGSSGAITVTYATADGTAIAGTDYTQTSGSLSWATGDASSSTIVVPISTATPFSGNKSFTLALSSPTGGATLSTPSSATISISGATGATGGPSAVTNLQLVNQGGPNLPLTLGASGTILTNYQKISWTAATPGASPIASYNVYRNGVLYANTTATSYADTNATNSNVPSWSAAATVYSYNVAAVDNAGNEGPQAAQSNAWGYLNGVSYWNHDDLSYSGATANYFSTAGNPQGGTTDVAATFPGMGGWLPVAGPTMAPTWDVEIGAFNYFVIDINPGNTVPSSGTVELIMQSRLPPGDEASWGNGFNVFDYGPAPKANTWATYKVPLSAYHFGTGKFTGSISGTKLTVTALTSGFVDAGGFISGPGIPAGTYIVSYSQANSVGTFTLAGPGVNSSLNVSSEAMTFQRTDFYKFGLQPQGGFNGTMYFNNFGFTMN